MLHHKFHKLFNPNNVKISYNIKPVINSHYRKKIHPSSIIGKGTCRCISKALYPLNQKCHDNNNLYQVKITLLDETSKTKVH